MENGVGCPMDTKEKCFLFGAKDCSRCPMDELSDKKKAALRIEAEYMANTVPNGIYGLECSEECLFCTDGKHAPQYNAIASMGHERMEGCREPIPGVASDKGFLMSVKLPICGSCKQAYAKLWYLPKLLAAVVAMCFLIVLSIGSVREALASVHSALPLTAMLFGALLAVLIYLLLRRHLAVSLAKKTKLSIFEIDGMDELKENGWQELAGENKPASRLFFEKRDRARCECEQCVDK